MGFGKLAFSKEEKYLSKNESGKKAQLGELWALLIKDPLTLSDEDLNGLLRSSEELEERLRSLTTAFPENIKIVLRHNNKKRELSKLSTEELEKMNREFGRANAAFFRVIDAREEAGEEIGDSAFAPPPIDSEAHIVYELLQERKRQEPT